MVCFCLFKFSKILKILLFLKDWEDLHLDKNITSAGSKYTPITKKFELPSDINSFTFNKFIQIYIKVNY